MNNALKGAYVLVTRPAHQAAYLSQLIEQRGGVAVRFPTIKIVALDEPATATKPLPKLSNLQWLIFTSANAVNFALKTNGGKIGEFRATQIAAIGKATAAKLQSACLEVNVVPKNSYDSESLLAMPQMQQVNGQAILIVRGQGGREELADVLRSRGAKVDYWEVYKRVIPDSDCSQVLNLLEQDKLDVIVITSCEALQNLVTMLGARYQKRMAQIPLVVISDRISRFAAEMGFLRIAVTECPSDPAILDAVSEEINRRGNKYERQ